MDEKGEKKKKLTAPQKYLRENLLSNFFADSAKALVKEKETINSSR